MAGGIIRDWKDNVPRRRAGAVARPDGAEAADYDRAGSPFRPANRPLQRLDELTRIKGFSDSLAARVAPFRQAQGILLPASCLVVSAS